MADDGGYSARFWGTWAKNFGSALVAGGAGAALTLVFGGKPVSEEAYIALQVLFGLVFVAAIVSVGRERTLTGRSPSWAGLVLGAALIVSGCVAIGLIVAEHSGLRWPLVSQGPAWWAFVSEGLVAAFVGGHLRFIATELLVET
jgi:hypothetical protein